MLKLLRIIAVMAFFTVSPNAAASSATPIQNKLLNGLTLEMPRDAALAVIEKRYKDANLDVKSIACEPFDEVIAANVEVCKVQEIFGDSFLGHQVNGYDVQFVDGILYKVQAHFKINKDKDGSYARDFGRVRNSLMEKVYGEVGVKYKLMGGRTFRWDLQDRTISVSGAHPGSMVGHAPPTGMLSLYLYSPDLNDRIKSQREIREEQKTSLEKFWDFF